jgi:glutamate/aspartate transport system substrate-binding protein
LESLIARWLTTVLSVIFGVMLLGASGAPVCAQELAGTLKKIRDSGTIAVGYYESEIPFSYLDGKGQVVGYSYDITQKIVESLAQALKLPRIDIKPIPLTLQNRFSMVQNKVVDIECVATTNTLERQKQFDFSATIFISSTRLMARKDAGIADFSDLAGKTVVTKASSTSEKLLRRLDAKMQYGINIISAVERSVSPLAMLQAGQADAYMLDDALLYGAIAQSWRPEEWTVTGAPQSYEAYGCIMRKNDPGFKPLVDQAIGQLMKSGTATQLYQKWFMSPIPPKGRILNLPMSDAIFKLYKKPNDSAFN